MLPNLAATESAILPHVPAELSETLKADHRKLRQLTERMAIVSEAMSRSHRAKSDSRTAAVALRDLTEALRQLALHEEAAVSRLEAALSGKVLDEATRHFAEAVERARAQIVLVAQPEVMPTESHVLRRRPDLDRAYVTNLSDVDDRQ